MVMSHDHSPVRVTENDLSAHVDELVDKEETALEHLLMDQDATSALGRHHEDDADEVRRKARPWSICHMQYRTIQEGIDHIALLLRNIDVVTATLQIHTETAESLRNHSQFVISHILDGKRTAVHGRQSDE